MSERHLHNSNTFKSDVSSAFLNLPAHPIWQLRQVVTVDTQLFIVCQLVFSNWASPRIWCTVSGLLCWIAIHKLGIHTLHDFLRQIYPNFDTNHAHPFVQATIVGSKKIWANPPLPRIPCQVPPLLGNWNAGNGSLVATHWNEWRT